ncbi:MAG: hypothetical protein CSA11_09200 [Chloroflexi bacterium]|nr:MAG: hypothetical protein CSA11_09200 [Chloroflexota bacterium]
MRLVVRILLVLLILIILVGAAFFLFRRPADAAFGSAVALCPGPDLYGYTCTGGDGFAAIDATNDTGLYADDGIVSLDLPFVFTYYGTEYTELQASSNGNIQFGNNNAWFDNLCLADGPAPNMGDMIAPYWDDFDLTFTGFLETEIVGEEPNRIFVVEWDSVSLYEGDAEDVVTFSVQLFEGSNNILFMYEDVGMVNDGNGRSATIGMQSEAQGTALQYSCNQASVSDHDRLHIPHPENANADLGRENVLYRPQEMTNMNAKGDIADLITMLERHGPPIMEAMQRQWLNQQPQRMSEWIWLEDDNGRSHLILLWRGTQERPDLSQLILLSPDNSGGMALQFSHHFASRAHPFAQIELIDAADVTADGLVDVLLKDASNGRAYLFTTHDNAPTLHTLPQTCTGHAIIQDGNIIRSGCTTTNRLTTTWDGTQFMPQNN